MKVSILGLGYVGAVSAGCLAADGHDVIGIDPNQTKVDLINQGLTPIIEEDIGDMIAGKQTGRDFGVCNNPEFLREGTAVWDYYNPPKTVIGETDTQAGDVLVQLYAKIAATLIRTDVETAEMVKCTDNAWHALKVVFATRLVTSARRWELTATT